MQKTCRQCSAPFGIFPEDKKFYREMGVPEPALCPFCRMIRRLAYRNERHLYHRKCDLTGRQIISAFSTDKPFPVYSIDAWWSDDWDPLSFGREFNMSRPFFGQFFELRDRVPRMALQQQQPMENSEYCNCASKNRNCYLIFSSNRSEECYYGSWINDARNCIDNLNLDQCDLCYECVSCRSCYRLLWSRDCINCSDSAFLRSCTGCKNCFGGSNLVNRQYVVFNVQKTKEQYEAFLKEVNVGSFAVVERIREKVDAELADLKAKEYHGANIEASSGDYLRDCRRAHLCFECDRCEDVRYCQCIYDARDCMDHSYWGGRAERCYDCQACGYDLHDLKFCNLCWSGCSDLIYCDHCFSCQYCFGCVSLKKKQYCIFNRQYSREEYENLVPQIITHMKESGEWGQFFPVAQSPFAYNESLAQEHDPLPKTEVVRRGWQWHEEEDGRKENYLGPPVIAPDDILNVPDAICSQILTCSVTGRPFKIIPQELKFYRETGIPLPRRCPDQRHAERMSLRNPRTLWKRTCAKCQKSIETSYAPERPEKVYCEECYLKEVY
ncbi:MAG: hypothetical protein PHE68_04765 [Candidatus Peribacteraceae bacterium]|nr:hypothetical protein [Candidatus Peribacteraceae bacterium]MDD5074712.1 hypothetical protein [Candidatus Peribacteraceae bacterium]